MNKIGYADFLQILQLDEVGDWVPGHILKPDGVCVEPPDKRLTREEKKAMLAGVTGSLAEPILRFPCSVADMERYVSMLDDSVVEENLREWVSAHKDEAQMKDSLPEAGYTPANLRAVIQSAGITQAAAAALIGANERTIRKWMAPLESPSHRDMPLEKWIVLIDRLRE